MGTHEIRIASKSAPPAELSPQDKWAIARLIGLLLLFLLGRALRRAKGTQK